MCIIPAALAEHSFPHQPPKRTHTHTHRRDDRVVNCSTIVRVWYASNMHMRESELTCTTPQSAKPRVLNRAHAYVCAYTCSTHAHTHNSMCVCTAYSAANAHAHAHFTPLTVGTAFPDNRNQSGQRCGKAPSADHQTSTLTHRQTHLHSPEAK